MVIHRLVMRTVPAVLGGALAVAALSATPASASSGWWTSQGKGAEGFYNHVNGRVYANDIKTDGYSAVTQILTYPSGHLITSVKDKLNNNAGSWITPRLHQGGDYMIRVCVVKSGHKPTKCSTAHWFEA
ncbi:hypothetical protein [Streptomyces sp. NPDC002611]